MLTKFVLDGGADLDHLDETPDAFVIACIGQPLAPENRDPKTGPPFRFHHHVKALDVGQILGIVFLNPRPESEIDVAFFDDFLRNLSLRAVAPSSYRNPIGPEWRSTCLVYTRSTECKRTRS
jgi:hypothetical protein